MTVCNGCGDCCEVVMLTGDLASLKARPDVLPANAAWFRSGALVPLTREQAIAKRPVLGKLYPGDWPMGPTDAQPYACRNFDEVARTCRLHGSPAKPEICTGFPWYDRPADEASLAPFPRCSFWADVQPAWLLGLA